MNSLEAFLQAWAESNREAWKNFLARLEILAQTLVTGRFLFTNPVAFLTALDLLPELAQDLASGWMKGLIAVIKLWILDVDRHTQTWNHRAMTPGMAVKWIMSLALDRAHEASQWTLARAIGFGLDVKKATDLMRGTSWTSRVWRLLVGGVFTRVFRILTFFVDQAVRIGAVAFLLAMVKSIGGLISLKGGIGPSAEPYVFPQNHPRQWIKEKVYKRL